jgi:hypothetical protein
MHPLTALLLPVASLALTACQTMSNDYVRASEMAPFEAKPVDKRVTNVVMLRWEVREDVAAYCAKVTGMSRDAAYTTPPLACAIWSVAARECTIVTSKVTTHLALGHEVRHCFEGRFHD